MKCVVYSLALTCSKQCKLRKRRCDGSIPCGSCQRYQYECYYSPQQRRRSTKVQSSDTATSIGVSEPIHTINSPSSSPNTSRSDRNDVQSPETNSGISFPQLVSAGLNPDSAPKLQGLGWNLGLHYRNSYSEKSITWILSKDEWITLLATYVQKIHSVYSFLDLAVVRSKSANRWDDTSATNSYDHVLCGIAALACLFTPGPIEEREYSLVECAREILESARCTRQPDVHEAQASLLRLLYLRCVCPPHAAWMTSGTTMQIIEASGLHKEPLSIPGNGTSTIQTSVDTQCRRKTYWLAKMLNTWISNEYGRTSFNIIGSSCLLPTPSSGDYTTDFLAMLHISVILEPEKSPTVGELETALHKVQKYAVCTDPLLLSRANLGFTLYRRLRLVTGTIKNELLNIVISIGREGLQASLRATQAWTPWWHVSNIPFQFTCILLSMDTAEALSHVAEAVTVLRTVANTFRSSVVQTALATVEQLVMLSQKRKQQDIVSLAAVPRSQSVNSNDQLSYYHNTNTLLTVPNNIRASDLLWNFPGLDNMDWNQFWDNSFTEPLLNVS